MVGVIYFKGDEVKISSFDVNNIDKIYTSKKIFETVGELITYLREIRFDYSIDFDLVKVVDVLISSLYSSGFMEMNDIIGK
jgi:hypothetical protein